MENERANKPSERDFDDLARRTQEDFRDIERAQFQTLNNKGEELMRNVRDVVREYDSTINLLGDSNLKGVHVPGTSPHQEVVLRIRIPEARADKSTILEIVRAKIGETPNEDCRLEVEYKQSADEIFYIIDIYLLPTPSGGDATL